MKLKSLTPNLMVEDVVKTAAYYEDLLGFKVANSVEAEDGGLTWAMLQKDEVSIMLESQESMEGTIEVFKEREIGGSQTFFITTDDAQKIYNSIQEKVNIISELTTTPYNHLEFSFMDINGYILTISEELSEQ